MRLNLDEKGHTTRGNEIVQDSRNHMRVISPVCITLLYEDNLVDADSIVGNNLYCAGGISPLSIQLSCDCEHRFNREGVTQNEPHNLAAGVDAVFDESGMCIHREITEGLPG